MAEQKNALKALIVTLNDIFKAVSAQLNDVESKKEVLRALGLNPAGANLPSALPVGSLTSIQQFVGKSDAEIDIEAFASVLLDTLAVAQAIESFADAVAHAEDPDVVNDFLDILLQLFTMDAMRLRADKGAAKAFYQVSQAIGMYEELAAPSGGVRGLTKNIGGFAERLFGSWNAEDPAEAAMMMDVIFFALAIVSFKWASVRDHLRVSYGFDSLPGSPSPNADLISGRTLTAELSYTIEAADGTEIEAHLVLSFVVRPQNEQGFGIEVLVGGGGKFEQKFGDWKVSFAVDGVPDVDLRAKIGVEHDGELPTFHVGRPTGTNLTIGAPSVEVTASLADQDLDIKLNTEQGGFVLQKDKKTDGFLNSIMPENPIFGAFDFGIGYSLKKGLYVDGGSGLTVLVPLHVSVGGLVLLNSFFLKLTGNGKGNGVLVETSVGLSTKFLGFAATIERVGLIHNLSIPEGKKNAGLFNIDIAFKPPNGVGLSLDLGILKGGGFLYFDPDKGEYFGAIELSFKGSIAIKAIGIINTKMPDGSKGFSMLVIITVEKFQPITLPFGLFLTGVGGLLGLHRTARIDVLREGIKTNALKSILFPEDVVANMSRIISDLRQVFPPLKDRFLVAPMAQITWGTGSMITLELGLLLEIPLLRIAILGVLKVLMPKKEPSELKLQVNFLGVIDFDEEYISFDASLYDSKLLTFTLTGDMALRVKWGAEKAFILSVGGFHPAYKEAPGDLQNMTRLTISLLSGENPRITAQCYFAVTSNTVQFGAKVELYAAASGFNIYGFLGLDVLFHFNPFYFVAALAAGVALRRGSNVIMGIRVSGQLSGPKPWDVRGEASVSMLFFSVSVPFHKTWGDDPDVIADEFEDLTQRLTAELNDDRNWRADPPRFSNLHVSIKKVEAAANKVVVHPFGVLTFSERLVPLGVTIEKFGLKKPKDANRFTIAPTDTAVLSEAASELFAPANFLDLNDSEKLSRPSFETMPSGFRITGYGALQVPAAVNKSVDYELTYVRKNRGVQEPAGGYKFSKELFKASLRGGAVAKSSLSFLNNRPSVNGPDEVKVEREGFEIVTTSDMNLATKNGTAGSYTEAAQQMKALLTAQPSLAGQVQVVSTYELNEA